MIQKFSSLSIDALDSLSNTHFKKNKQVDKILNLCPI